ncbi:MAG: hypothetical protein ABSA31_00350 [Acidimicrobiales bacterium]|jgi:hypothetical protein
MVDGRGGGADLTAGWRVVLGSGEVDAAIVVLSPIIPMTREEASDAVDVVAGELPVVVELDLNPVLATPEAAVAVDCRVHVAPVRSTRMPIRGSCGVARAAGRPRPSARRSS